MDYEKILEIAEEYLKKNDFGLPHTLRVFAIAKKNFEIPKEIEELVFCSIIMHDIGGSTIEEQYKNGPKIASLILENLGYDRSFIEEVCHFIKTHHEHPNDSSLAFKILYDSDKLVMFSPEEFPYYNSNPNFDWKKIINLMYYRHTKNLAKKFLKQRKNK